MLTTIIFIILVAILLVTIITIAWLYFYKRKYTRERFAFTLAASYFSALTLVVYYVFSPNYLSVVANYLLTNILHQPEIQLEEPGFAEKCLAIIILIIYYWYTNNLYRNWKGGKSVEEAENIFNVQNMSVFLDFYQFISNSDSRILSSSIKKEASSREMSFEVMSVENIIWHEQVAELLKLTDTQFKIDVENDWYRQENCYISRYGRDGQDLAILCSSQIIADAKISAFIKFAKNRRKNTSINIRFIWAIRENVNFNSKRIDNLDIEVVTETTLLEGLVDFSDYKRYIKNKYEKEPIFVGYPLTINNVYVEPTCTVYDIIEKKDNNIDSVEKYLIDWLNDDSQHKQLALWGEYGQGKSVLSLRLAYLLLSGQKESKRIPIIINLRGKFIESINSILSDVADELRIPVKSLLKLHYAGKLLLIFEGFDELLMIGDQQVRKNQFRNLWKFSTPSSKIIITGRPNYFMDDKEMIMLLRLSQTQAGGAKYCEAIKLRPFNREQIVSAIRSIKPSVQKEILDVYDSQNKNLYQTNRTSYYKSSFIDLVSRPSSLSLLILIWEKQNLAQKVQTINSAVIIKTFLNDSYKRQDEKYQNKKNNKIQKTILHSVERAYFMQGIAVAMVKSYGYTNQIKAKEFESIVEKLFLNFPDEITKECVDADSRLVKDRLNSQNLLPTIKTDIRSCGVLVKDFSTEDTFGFAHKSFLEVLIADFISVFYLKKKDSMSKIHYVEVKAIINSLGIKPNELYMYDENVFNFLVELMSANITLEGEENTKERVNSIYRQLHFYPFKLKSIGWLVRIFGLNILFTNYMRKFLFWVLSLLIYISLIAILVGWSLFDILMIYVGCLLLLVGHIIIVNDIIIARYFNKIYDKFNRKYCKSYHRNYWKYYLYRVFSLFLLMTFRLMTVFNRAKQSKLLDLKIFIFFLVCKNFHSEKALKKIWPLSVYKIVESIAYRWIKYKNM